LQTVFVSPRDRSVTAAELNRVTAGFGAQRADVAESHVVLLGRFASHRGCGEQPWPPA